MLSLTPQAIELVDYVDDGEATRHFTFRLLNPKGMDAPRPGQFFMLHIAGVGEAPFTFTELPDANGVFRALVRNVGLVTGALFDCQRGITLGARGPYGRAWPVAELHHQRVLIVAGGCGLAPLVSLTDALLEQDGGEPLALLYGAATEGTQMLNPERQRWREQMSVFDVVDDKTYSGLTGTPLDVLDEVLENLGHMPSTLLLCGPEVMMQRVAEAFIERGMPTSSIWLSVERRMHCAVGLCGHCYLGDQYVCKDGPTYCWDEMPLGLTQNPLPTNAAPSS